MLTTKTKMKIAKALSVGIRAIRNVVGLSDKVRVKRGDVLWDLDLNEGIDLAIYLNTYQVIGRRVRELLRPDMVMIDIGANVGAFTLPLSKLVGLSGKVIAVEATKFAFDKLSRNLALNPELASVVLSVQALLVGPDGGATPDAIYSSWRLDDFDTENRHPSHLGIGMSTEGASVTTLDALLNSDERFAKFAKRIEFIKLDVDGNELQVLRGARQTIGISRPLILLELAPYVQNETSQGLTLLLAEIDDMGYKIRSASEGRDIPNSEESITRLISHGAGIDVLCYPADRVK